MNNNPVLALMSTDSEDDFIRDVVEAYFANPAHVRRILTEDCIESCLDAYMGNQTVELDLNDLPKNQDGFTKPSRKNRRKHDKKASKRKGSAKRFRDRSRKCAHEGHMYSVYSHGNKKSRTHSINIRINTNGTQSYTESAQDYTEGEVNQLFSMNSRDYPMEQFLSRMDNYDWKHLPNGIGFYVNWDLVNPLYADWSTNEFSMTATLKKGKDIVTAEKAKEEYLEFRKTYEVYQKYAEKVRALREEMKAELATERK